MNEGDTYARLAASDPRAVFDHLLTMLAPGQHVLYIRPLTGSKADYPSGWPALVRRRAVQWGALLASDPELRLVAWGPHAYKGSCCIDTALLYVKSGHGSTTPTTAASSPKARQPTPGRQALINTLAVLTRPQIAADLDPQILNRLKRRGPATLGIPDLPLMRLAAITPWGEKVFLVPFKPFTASEKRALERGGLPGLPSRAVARILSHRPDQETLGVFTQGQTSSSGSCCATAANVGAIGSDPGFIGSFQPSHGTGYTRLIFIVPDGVAKVAFVLPRLAVRRPASIDAGTSYRPSKHSLTVTVQAHGNVVAVQVTGQCCSGQIPTIWYGYDGQVLKRFGNPSSANRIIRPRPGHYEAVVP